MVFVVDIGNTNIVLGIFLSDKLVASWRLSTDTIKTFDEYEIMTRSFLSLAKVDPSRIKGAIIASVVPNATQIFQTMICRLFGTEPLVVGAGIKTGIPIKTDNPREVGADRIANTVAAYELYGGPAIVVDFGTATTFDVISSQGEYLGGQISPGINISMEALFQKAAKLPRVALQKPASAIGKNTVASMQAGIYYSVIGGIKFAIQAIRDDLGCSAKAIATGGLAEVVGPHVKIFDVINGDLTLEGLRIIYNRNK
ncbi:MAG: type III pantothenate kinase [Bacillota bacterium]